MQAVQGTLQGTPLSALLGKSEVVCTGDIFSIKISEEKGLVVAFRRAVTRNDRIKLARGQSDMKFSAISPWSVCFLPFQSECKAEEVQAHLYD